MHRVSDSSSPGVGLGDKDGAVDIPSGCLCEGGHASCMRSLVQRRYHYSRLLPQCETGSRLP